MKLNVNKGQYGYSVLASNQQDDLKCYVQAGFMKGEEPPELCQIKVTNGFMSCYKKGTGEIVPKIVVLEYEVLKEYGKKGTATTQPKAKQPNPQDDSTDNFPF